MKKNLAIVRHWGLLQNSLNPIMTNNTEWVDLGPKPYILLNVILTLSSNMCLRPAVSLCPCFYHTKYFSTFLFVPNRDTAERCKNLQLRCDLIFSVFVRGKLDIWNFWGLYLYSSHFSILPLSTNLEVVPQISNIW